MGGPHKRCAGAATIRSCSCTVQLRIRDTSLIARVRERDDSTADSGGEHNPLPHRFLYGDGVSFGNESGCCKIIRFGSLVVGDQWSYVSVCLGPRHGYRRQRRYLSLLLDGLLQLLHSFACVFGG